MLFSIAFYRSTIKAAPYTHQAALKSCTIKMMIGMKPGEVAYTALPLYHTFASQVGVTGAVIAGGAVAVAPKFRNDLQASCL